MKGAVETMMGMIMIAFMAVLSAAYIMASLNTQSAELQAKSTGKRIYGFIR